MPMSGILVLLATLVATVHTAETTGCKVAMDCGDVEGRSLCHSGRCMRDVPCNKDDDCFFYGAADVAAGKHHPGCFTSDNIDTQVGYGVCMVKELVQHTEYKEGLTRLPGLDVEKVLEIL